MSGRKGSFASRSLEYRAPEVPNFLKALKAQVASSDRYAKSSSGCGDQLDSFVASTSSSAGKRRAREDEEDDGLDSEDEMSGAQVVVLKDGKHLSHQEALGVKASLAKQGQSASSSSHAESKPQTIATSGGPAKRKREAIGGTHEPNLVSISSVIEAKSHDSDKKGGGALEEVKQLIRKDREAHASHSSQAKQSQPKSKDEQRKEKNAQARKLKAKAGKGLSFNLDD